LLFASKTDAPDTPEAAEGARDGWADMAKGAGWCDDDEDADAGDERWTGDDMLVKITEGYGGVWSRAA
jgi:hypothetical protein